MGDESTREPDPAGDSNPPAPAQPNGWRSGPTHEWEHRPNQAWQTGAPESWSARPNDAWQTGAPQSWDTRPNPLWQSGGPSDTAPTVPLPAEAAPQPTAPTEPLAGVYAPGSPTAAPPQYAPPAQYGTPPQYGAPPQYAPPQQAAPPYGTPPVPTSAPQYGAPAPSGATPPPGSALPSYAAGPAPERRRRTGLWIGVGVVIVAAVIGLIVIFSIWLGNQVQSLVGATAQPVTESSESAAPRPTPSATRPTENPSTAPTATASSEQPTGDRVPLDVASALPEGADFTVAHGNTWMDLGSTFLGDENGELWATSLTGIYGEISDEDARAATEALIRVLSAGSTDGVQSAWVTGADGRSYEFLTAESDGIGVLVRVEPESGRQFALMFGGTTTEVVANLILE